MRSFIVGSSSGTGVYAIITLVITAFTASACSSGGSSGSGAESPELESGQAASLVIGQQSLTEGERNQDGDQPDMSSLDRAYGAPLLEDGVLYVPDYGNNRVLAFEQGIPDVNGQVADFVLGQDSGSDSDSGTAADAFNGPGSMLTHDGKFLLADLSNNRVLIWDEAPTANTPADTVLGQDDMQSSGHGCDASSMRQPHAMAIVEDKLVVSDTRNNRLLVWEEFPTENGQAADAVIAQPDLESCDGYSDVDTTGNRLSRPLDIWSDGQRLVVPDLDNHRVLIWNAWPGTGEETRDADVVLGQTQLTGSDSGVSESKLNFPLGAYYDGVRLFVTDASNHRVLVWESWPETHGAPADVVIGQDDFESAEMPDEPTASAVANVYGVLSAEGKMLVASWEFSRVLIFE